MKFCKIKYIAFVRYDALIASKKVSAKDYRSLQLNFITTGDEIQQLNLQFKGFCTVIYPILYDHPLTREILHI